MITHFEIVQLPKPLQVYLERMFMIENPGRMPSDDLKLMVQNACAKLVIPSRNELSVLSAAAKQVTQEGKAAFIGVSDTNGQFGALA